MDDVNLVGMYRLLRLVNALFILHDARRPSRRSRGVYLLLTPPARQHHPCNSRRPVPSISSTRFLDCETRCTISITCSPKALAVVTTFDRGYSNSPLPSDLINPTSAQSPSSARYRLNSTKSNSQSSAANYSISSFHPATVGSHQQSVQMSFSSTSNLLDPHHRPSRLDHRDDPDRAFPYLFLRGTQSLYTRNDIVDMIGRVGFG